MSPAQALVTAVAVLVAALTQSTTGFGFALLAVPLLSFVVPTETAVVLCATLSLFSSGAQAFGERAHRDGGTIGAMLTGVVLGSPLGLVVLLVLTSRQLKLVLALVIFAFLAVTARGLRLERASRPLDVGAGFVSGVLNTSLSTNGPPAVMALHARDLPPATFRSTIATVFVVSNVVAVGLFAASGRYDRDVAVLLVAAVPALAVGYVVGARHRHRFAPGAFRRLVLALLAATGVVTLLGVVTAP